MKLRRYVSETHVVVLIWSRTCSDGRCGSEGANTSAETRQENHHTALQYTLTQKLHSVL